MSPPKKKKPHFRVCVIVREVGCGSTGWAYEIVIEDWSAPGVGRASTAVKRAEILKRLYEERFCKK